MIKKLTQSDQTLILDFANRREEENMFITGTFKKYKDPFEQNSFYGYFDGEKMLGLAVHFGNWNNININSQDEKIVRALTDHLISEGFEIEDIACFRSYGDIIMDQLETKHGLKAKKLEEKSIYKLLKEDFVDFSTGKEETATEADREALIITERLAFENDMSKPITETELARVMPQQEFIIRMNGKIVAKANLNGLSEHYFQIGGVGTLKEYRRQGLAKRVVSALCKHHLAQGKSGLLFTNNDNIASIKVYSTLGFKPFDKYMIATYRKPSNKGSHSSDDSF